MKTLDLEKLTIVCYPDPVLRKQCEPVEMFDEGLQALAARMLVLMRENNGVGLAAPQVGIPIRLFVANPSGEEGDDHVYVNPELGDFEGAEELTEGCLSLPEVNVSMRRSFSARMSAQTPAGEEISERAEGWLARIWQHETDHLNGRLIIDKMSSADEIANRKAIKQLKDDYKRRR